MAGEARYGTVLWRGRPCAGVFEEESVKLLGEGSLKQFLQENALEEAFPTAEARYEEVSFLPPIPDPQKIICVGLNYRDHADELRRKKLLTSLPKEPVIFLKPPSSLIGHKQEIIWPREAARVDYEGEVAVVVGKRCRGVRATDASSYILGYSCFNDVTARDLQKRDVQWTRAKSFDTFSPFGPWIATGVDASGLRIQTLLNGRVVQDSNTENMIFPISKLIEFISGVMTLEPGDVIATGTPAGVGPMKKGDIVKVKAWGVGELENPIT
ncbi:MAG: fumarylacetoacetate hydrolase family protein [Candidatus Micrarchaeia archaeon]